jgi:hypothetical protein
VEHIILPPASRRVVMHVGSAGGQPVFTGAVAYGEVATTASQRWELPVPPLGDACCVVAQPLEAWHWKHTFSFPAWFVSATPGALWIW